MFPSVPISASTQPKPRPRLQAGVHDIPTPAGLHGSEVVLTEIQLSDCAAELSSPTGGGSLNKIVVSSVPQHTRALLHRGPVRSVPHQIPRDIRANSRMKALRHTSRVLLIDGRSHAMGRSGRPGGLGGVGKENGEPRRPAVSL